MPIQTAITRRFGRHHPIIQAPLAGGGDTPALVSAVAEAGALGFIGAAYLTPAQIAETACAVRERTSRSFGISLFAPQPAPPARFVVSNGRDDRLQTVVGLNYTRDDLNLPGLEQVVIIAEYAREVVLTSRRSSPILDVSVNPRLGEGTAFRNAVAGRLQLKFSENTRLKLSSVVDLEHDPNAFVQIMLSHKLFDTLQIDAGLDLFGGGRDTFWGGWRDNDRFFAVVKYFF